MPTHRLIAEGVSPRRIAAMTHAGQLVRVRQGWYVLPHIDDELSAAARVGGQLTCTSALARHGLWVLASDGLHVAVNRTACQLRDPADRSRRLRHNASGVVVHWRRESSATTALLSPVEAALADYRRCADLELYLTAVDSALHRHALSAVDVRAVLRYAEPFGVDGTCQSGIESLFWLRMRRHHLPTRRQVWIEGVGYVDFLLGSRLVVEVDGYQYHSRAPDFERDRRRDTELSRLGYRVLRFSYQQVVDAFASVESAVLAAALRGDLH